MGSARDSAPDPKWAGSPVRPPPSARLRLHPVSTITPAVQAHIDDLGERPRAAVNALFRRLKVPAQMVGIGSLFNIHFTDESVVGYRAVARGDRRMFLLLRLALMNRGIIIALRAWGSSPP